LRPIMMTALATIAGMLPLAFAIGAGSQMLQPLAIAVVGGLLSSMVLSLIFTPAINYYLQPKPASERVERPVPTPRATPGLSLR
jgi:multidrug efflux pump subunit AcrB